jgi:hypothetical protein
MNFLTPWFLLGGAAIAGPIIFHLIRRAARERSEFSSLMFLRPTPPRAVRRSKMEHLFLLLLRSLCLLLLAGAFARPFFPKDIPLPETQGRRREVILLIDTSASMRREGLWAQAQATARRYLEKAEASDEVAISTFDRRPSTLVSFSEWAAWGADQRAALAEARLAGISPVWMNTRLGTALTGVAEQFQAGAKAQPASQREIVLISDMQEGASLEGLQGHDWPAGARVIVERVNAKSQSNAGLEIIEAASGPDPEDKVHARVSNASSSSKERFQLRWRTGERAAGPAADVYVLPGRTLTATAPPLPAGAKEGTLELTGDDISFDNLSYFAAPEIDHVGIAYFGSEPSESPSTLLFYLRRAFPDTPRRRVEFVSAGEGVDAAGALDSAAFAVVANSCDGGQAAALRQWMEKGKSVLLVLGNSKSAETLGALLNNPGARVTESDGQYALLGEIDFKHPLFSAFDDPRYSDFSHIHFWKHRRLEMPASVQSRVIAKFDDGSPALTQFSVGKGNLLALASGWTPSDSQLAVSSKFAPLMQTILDWSGGSAPSRTEFRTGETLPSPVASGSVQWTRPDGKTQTTSDGAAFTDTDLPGIYRAQWAGKERRFAVNLAIEESRVGVLATDELARLGVPMGPEVEPSAAQRRNQEHHLQTTELENRQKLWRWLIVAALGFTLGEMALSGVLARRVSHGESTI